MYIYITHTQTALLPSPSPSPCVCVYIHTCAICVCIYILACVCVALTVGRLSGMRLCCHCPTMCAVFSRTTTSSRALYLSISISRSLSPTPPLPSSPSFTDSQALSHSLTPQVCGVNASCLHMSVRESAHARARECARSGYTCATWSTP
jgi:hypothetical protein